MPLRIVRVVQCLVKHNARIFWLEMRIPIMKVVDIEFPSIRTFEEKRDIIMQFQAEMSPEALKQGACAVCAHNLLISDLHCVDIHKVPLHLLHNDCLPEHMLPHSYDLEMYSRAILYPKGMKSCWSFSDLFMCCPPRQPYYAHDRLPDNIRHAFTHASASQITHFYSYKSSTAQYRPVEQISQQYNKGNVAVRPQDSVKLYSMLPPSYDELRDAMCVVFSGQKEWPSCDTVKQLRPILVTKSRVRILIEFLITNNPCPRNMDSLFDNVDADVDCSVPATLEVCHLPRGVDVPEDDASEDIVMEAVGFTQGDHSSQSREKMKLHALAYVLDRKCFLLSRTGVSFIADNDPGLMSYLFPHIDPWDIGAQDTNFAFICWNMIQKREISSNTTFRSLVRELKDKWTCSIHEKPSTTQEKKAACILRRSIGYKLCRRNEIRALMKKYCTPAHIVSSIVDIELDQWMTMSSFERAKVIAVRPDAAALAFDLQIQAFLNIILKYKHGPGIFGHCQAYYGMVEAQGRGTLHCHIPQALRDRLASDASFKSNMFHCKLPYDKGPVPETSPNDACKPVRTHELDPRLERSPQVAEMDAKSFEYEFKKFLSRLAVECNWHIHSETCYKHLKNGQKKGDSTCRMRLDGSVQDVTTIDIETGSIELRRWRGRCNTDTQFIGSGEAVKAAVFYITEYITKGDLPLHVALQALEYAPKMHNAKYITDPQVDPQKKDSNLLTKSVNAMMGWQEMSHQQVIDHTFETIKWIVTEGPIKKQMRH
ncbi:uncharacterized protein F5147DRAFT_749549 [Suillus discolor]|uniref:Helitron helicase-like domain-containing protein n=1 Tax=Suillus discolor TaxID=1912936 RepID=A0A9P7EQH9_9AGAM|nr:uncharacterized protein F5147DRAFT_749549 [Suillus discolor]KAG2079451.1 hypothetical protein F5147DRAFT_749549 [Suillus discolor]